MISSSAPSVENRLHSHLMDTFVNLTTTTTPSKAPSPLLDLRGRHPQNEEGRSSSSSILANFRASQESSELLFDAENGSQSAGGGVGGGGEESADMMFRGGNFQLVLEEFGQYFYNFNGTSGGGAGGSSGLDFIGGNFSNYDFSSNCSLANSTCGPATESK